MGQNRDSKPPTMDEDCRVKGGCMHNISLEESRKRFPVGTPGGIFVYRLQTDSSQFVMDVVEHIHELGLQRAVIVVQEGVPETVILDATERITELLENRRCPAGSKQIVIECLHGLTRTEIRRMKLQWEKSRRNQF